MRTLRLGCVALCVLAVSGITLAEDYEDGLAAHYYKDATNWNGLWPSDADAPLADNARARILAIEADPRIEDK
ncbi:MAG: hypothetical protein ABIF82_03380 [Planctomycetota bacterium]